MYALQVVAIVENLILFGPVAEGMFGGGRLRVHPVPGDGRGRPSGAKVSLPRRSRPEAQQPFLRPNAEHVSLAGEATSVF
eukprot:scaffold107980_cov31-Prasinocladus_malaysianus.AAC.1